jgi:hypothetical protein
LDVPEFQILLTLDPICTFSSNFCTLDDDDDDDDDGDNDDDDDDDDVRLNRNKNSLYAYVNT